MGSGDSVLRGITDDGSFRVITIRSTDMVRAAVAAQNATGEPARVFGELLTGAVMYRETMAPTLRVQCVLQGAGGRGQIVADSMPGGGARGLVRLKGLTSINLRGGAILQMMRTLPRGDLHRGVVEVPDSGSISDGLMAYMQTSEQVISVISVGCQMNGDEVEAAGGYIVQLLPELEEGMLMVMTERLKDFRTIDDLLTGVASDPRTLMGELLYGMEHTELEESPVQFACTCDQVRVMTSLASLAVKEIEELMDDGRPIEMTCDYCQKMYEVSPEQLRGLVAET